MKSWGPQNCGLYAFISTLVALAFLGGSASAGESAFTVVGTEQETVHGVEIPYIVVRHAGTGITLRVQAASKVRSCRYREIRDGSTVETELPRTLSDSRCWSGLRVEEEGVRNHGTYHGRPWRMVPGYLGSDGHWVERATPVPRVPVTGSELPPQQLACLTQQMDTFQPYFDGFSATMKQRIRDRGFQVTVTDNLQGTLTRAEFLGEGIGLGNFVSQLPESSESGLRRDYTLDIGVHTDGSCQIAGDDQFRQKFDEQGTELARTEGDTLRQWEEILRRSNGFPETGYLDEDARELVASAILPSSGGLPESAVQDEELYNPFPTPLGETESPRIFDAERGV